ncbi:homocysteine S-methyltransferase-like isoform X2 [Atheta coriaria]|uniref:homocysteine S-methyltransferase-like isoform X2 n=1 Tax=Dalotia coriaria TaxID=877792 RepID=UPI0031F41513
MSKASLTNGDASNVAKDEIILLDGGFASQLSCHVNDPIDGHALWSSRFLATDPEAVVQTHLDFLTAGAQVILTNTYQASVGGFSEHLNLSEEDSLALIKKAVQLANTALTRYLAEFPDQPERKPVIAGSIGPYGASLHDASEYNGSYAAITSTGKMREWHLPRMRALIEEGVTLLALETIPCRAEAEMLVELIKEFPHVKAWLTFTCREDEKSIASGEPFQETARKCYEMNPKQLIAVGVNCLAPRLVECLFEGINDDPKKPKIPLIVYPNSGESYNVEQGWINRDKCEPVETYVHKWLDMGVRFLGGCCRTYAADVSRIRNEIGKWERLHGRVRLT